MGGASAMGVAFKSGCVGLMYWASQDIREGYSVRIGKAEGRYLEARQRLGPSEVHVQKAPGTELLSPLPRQHVTTSLPLITPK